MKRTYQPHKVSRLRTHGFRARMATVGGRKVMSNRRRKGRHRLAVSVFKKLAPVGALRTTGHLRACDRSRRSTLPQGAARPPPGRVRRHAAVERSRRHTSFRPALPSSAGRGDAPRRDRFGEAGGQRRRAQSRETTGARGVSPVARALPCAPGPARRRGRDRALSPRRAGAPAGPGRVDEGGAGDRAARPASAARLAPRRGRVTPPRLPDLPMVSRALARRAVPRRSRSAVCPVASVLLLLIRGYQRFLSPFLGGQCRFYPSCSRYAYACIEDHGAARGSLLSFIRLCKCHPLHPGGHDPPPPRRALPQTTA